MNILLLTIPVSILLGAIFGILFLNSVRNGQYDDLVTPEMAPLSDDDFGEDENAKEIANANDRKKE